jgi:hypothetical protein
MAHDEDMTTTRLGRDIQEGDRLLRNGKYVKVQRLIWNVEEQEVSALCSDGFMVTLRFDEAY